MSAPHDRFGDLRAALAGPRTRAGFGAVCAILDDWPEDDPVLVEAAIPHALEALKGWGDEVRQATPRARKQVLSGHSPWSLALVATADYEFVTIQDISSFLSAHEPGTLRRLSLAWACLNEGQVDELVAHPVTPGLTHLKLFDQDTVLNNLIGSDRLANLESLDLHWSSFLHTHVHFDALMLATHFERLRCLSLPGGLLGQAEVARLVLAPSWPRLETLRISLDVGAGPAPLATLLDHIGGLALRALDLELYGADDDAMRLLASRLPAGVWLGLSLSESTLHGRDLEDIEGLTSLDLFESRVGQVAVESVTRCAALESLSVRASEFLLWHATEGLSGLRRLELDDVGVYDGHLLQWCLSDAAPDLEELTITCGGLTEETLRDATTWPRPKLARLALLGARIDGSFALARLLESDALPGLERLMLAKGGGRWGGAPVSLDELYQELDAARVLGAGPFGEVGGAGEGWARAERAARGRGLALRAELQRSVWLMSR